VLGEGLWEGVQGVRAGPAPRGGPEGEVTVAIKKLNPSGYQSKVEWMVSKAPHPAATLPCPHPALPAPCPACTLPRRLRTLLGASWGHPSASQGEAPGW